MACNTAPSNGTQLEDSSQGPLITTSSLFSDSLSSSCNYHKSFDFSNINIDSSQYGYLKQFHQTRIYVKDFEGMTTNGSKFGGKDSTYIISGNLPDSFSYRIGSEWANPLSDIFKGIGNLFLQVGSAAARNAPGKTLPALGRQLRSGINRAANFLIWNGTKPLQIQLKIPVIDDNSYQSGCGNVKTNLKEALEFLGCLTLPKLEGHLGFYTPAPSSLDLSIIYAKERDKDGNVTETGTFSMSPNKARIMVQIGGMFFIDNCIIKEVSVSYPNTKGLMARDDGSLTPILAEVTITISTIESLTSDVYTKMLWRKQQPGQGKGEVNIPEMMQHAENALSYIKGDGNLVKQKIFGDNDGELTQVKQSSNASDFLSSPDGKTLQ